MNQKEAVGRRIPGLDGLRAVSILMVVVSHWRMSMPPALTRLEWLWRFAANSQLGVRIFFVISGYLITHLLVVEYERTGSLSLFAFYRRRALRIFPAFYAYIAVIGVVAAFHIVRPPAPSDFLTAATFTWNYGHLWLPGNLEGHFLLGHFWTLSLEEQFYLIWPFTLSCLGPLRARRVAATIILAMPLVRVASYFAWPACRPAIAEMLHTMADSLMFGALAALMSGSSRFEAVASYVARTRWPTIVAALAALVLSPILKARFAGAYELSLGWSLECLATTVVLIYVTRRPTSPLGRILNSRPAVTIGVLSYSLYLWSMFFFTGVNRTWTGIFPVNILFCVAAAACSYYGWERPLLRLGARINRPNVAAR